ncbi:hypothetical protein [Hydrogenovibrio marinus]|uniref:Uncharacterized protein n=1 Tax=Hydrogenovibrio marinus TaxID=28885 RepID=A0A066ZX19_HYDMR|nr:hypothetical protein [Hydrogenovibrio marinus]KDN94635.1 hypothetical protein EI16_12095 [Hydrogenovibrio marinus]
MANWIECEVYCAPSSSGGKVWVCPANMNQIPWTMSGTKARFDNSSLTVNTLNTPKDAWNFKEEKRQKGYSYFSTIWVESGTFRMRKDNPNIKSESELERDPISPSPPEAVYEIKSSGLFNF